jgi:hypothetical protein
MTITPDSSTTLLSSKTFLVLPQFNINYQLSAKLFKQTGDLTYEYNALHNLQLSTGQLTYFQTPELKFDLNHPVDIQVQPSYDGTINLVLNDNTNPPKLINTRFTPIADNRYQIIDRIGNTDTNIYRQGIIGQSTRLFKTTSQIPYVVFEGLVEGGALKCGNYVFYFKYADADGNESDIVTESGIISCYVGKLDDPFSTRGGMANELTNKIAKFTLNNIDSSYDYLNIYFTRATADYNDIEVIEAFKISTRKVISGNSLSVTITGLEDTIQIGVEDLNIQYNTVDAVKTQAQIQNRLFLGNITRPTIDYKNLSDLALRIYPSITNNNNIGYIDQTYTPLVLSDGTKGYEYYDASNVYNYTGFWNKEIYRLGVVFVLKDDSLSPVFNIRGKDMIGAFTRVGTYDQDIATVYTDSPLYDSSNNRQYVAYDDTGYIKNSSQTLENARGVVRIAYNSNMINKSSNKGVYPLSITLNISSEVITELAKYIKGFVFVRQKRIPTILCQGISIGVDTISYIPTLKATVFSNTNTATTGYIAESFVNKSTQVVHDFNSRLLNISSGVLPGGGLLCPEALLRSDLYNEVFVGSLFNLSLAPFSSAQTTFTQDPNINNHFYVQSYQNNGASQFLYKNVKLTLIEDNKPLRYSGTQRFSTRVGIPETAWVFSWFGTENKAALATNILRGSYTGFVGCEGFTNETTIVDIHIPGYDPSEMQAYFDVRANSFHPYYAMSDRYDLNLLSGVSPYNSVIKSSDNIQFIEYRGDCYIGNYTCRMTRNFQDPSTPTNDTIVDPLTWITNYTGYTPSGGLDATKIANINLGDINAVKMGHWATFKLCSNINLAYRAIDESNSSERALTGKARAFFPLDSMSVSGESKIPESTVVNVGYNASTSSKVYIEQPDVPYIKNLFDNRVMWSDIHINDAFRNGYRVFSGLDYKDITRHYGAIVKLLEWRGDLLCVFEHGVGIISINERAMTQTIDGQSIFLKGSGVISELVQPLSIEYGTTWKDSVVQTPNYIYGIDTVGKKIWRTNGKQFELISDFKVQSFLNANITLTEAEKFPSVSLLNVKSHYNAFKQDVMFTYYDATRNNTEIAWSLCFNEQLNKWITRFSWIPVESANIYNIWFSFDRLAAKRMALVGYTLAVSPTAEGIVLSSVSLTSTTGNTVGTLSLKGHNYYTQYTQVFTIDNTTLDNSHFTISGTTLNFTGTGVSSWPKFSYDLYVRVGLFIGGTEVQFFYDYLTTKVNRSILSSPNQTLYDTYFSTWFWKHGQAGIFNISSPILPTNWYGRQEVFEFEFIVVDNPGTHKIFDNLMIIANDAEPQTFEFEVVGDTYTFKNTPQTYTNPASTYTTIVSNVVHTSQAALDIVTNGRRLGNMHYKEDLWDIEIKPALVNISGDIKQARIRDKYCRIKVTYSGTDLAIITSLVTMYTQSYA